MNLVRQIASSISRIFLTDPTEASDGVQRLARYISQEQKDHAKSEYANPTDAEIAILYEKLLTEFNDTRYLKKTGRYICIQGGNAHLGSSLNRVNDIIKQWGRDTGQARMEKDPSFTAGKYGSHFGVPLYRNYTLQDGIPRCDGLLIADDLSLVNEADLEHGKIVAHMNYTLKDALRLCRTENWGLVEHLAKNKKSVAEDRDSAFSLLREAVQAEQSTTCKLLLKAGLPLYDEREESIEPLFQMIREWDGYTLDKMLEKILRDHYKGYYKAPHPFLSDIAYHLARRYEKQEFEPGEEFVYGTCFKLYSRSCPSEEISLGDFAQAILQAKKQYTIMFRPGFDNFLSDMVNGDTGRHHYSVHRPQLPTNPPLKEEDAANAEELGEIVRHMGYTFNNDVLKLYKAQNFGLVRCLLKGSMEAEVARALLSRAMHEQKHFDMCAALWKAGLQIPVTSESDEWRAFNMMVPTFDRAILTNIVSKQIQPHLMDKEEFRECAKAILARFEKMHQADGDEFLVIQALLEKGAEALGDLAKAIFQEELNACMLHLQLQALRSVFP